MIVKSLNSKMMKNKIEQNRVVEVEVSGPVEAREAVVRLLRRYLRTDMSKEVPEGYLVALTQRRGILEQPKERKCRS